MAAPETQGAALSITAEQLQAAIDAAVSKALAARPVAAPAAGSRSRIHPRSVVQPKAPHERALEAGVVESEELHPDTGAQVSVAVRMDKDGALVSFAPSELTVLRAH